MFHSAALATEYDPEPPAVASEDRTDETLTMVAPIVAHHDRSEGVDA